MKKRSCSMKLVDVTRESASIHARRDDDKISSEEQASISTEQTSASTTLEQASSSTTLEQASSSTTLEQASSSATLEQASASSSLEQASASSSLKQTFASSSRKKITFSTFMEQVAAGTYVPPAPSTLEEQAIIFSEQPGVLQLKRLFKDSPRLSLPVYVNFGNLLAIAQRYVEFRGIIRLLLKLGEALPKLSKTEQKRIVRAVMKVEEYINEIVQYADKPYDPKEIDELFCHIGCRLDTICHALFKTKVLRYPMFLILGLDVYPSRNRRDLILREANVDVDENFLKRIGTTQTYYRTQLDTKYLTEISRDHPEFGPSIETAFNVSAAMKYLTYPGQVKVFQTLFELQENIKKLVMFKRFLEVDDFERYVPTVISKVGECLANLLKTLTDETRPPRPNKMPSCEPCTSVSKFVKNVNVKPEEYRPVYPQAAQKIPISYANIGIAQGRFRNLESLFHHLTAIKGAAYMHTFLYQSRINWFAIARQYKRYKAAVRQDLVQLRVWKDYMFWRLVEVQEVMADARALRDRIRGIRFTANETLSDCIALGGELELLVSEVEDFLTSIPELIEDFVTEWQRGVNLNRVFRRRRFLFLTNDQLTTFSFPY